MAPKKKNANKKGGNASKNDDFDLDALLEAEGLLEKPAEPAPAQSTEPAKEEQKSIQIENFANVDDAAAAFLNSLGGQPSAPSGGKKKNKKKKGGAAAGNAAAADAEGAGENAEEGNAAEEGGEAGAEAPAAGTSGAAANKKKKGKKEAAPPKLSAAALRIQAEMEKRRKLEEERRRIEEEERLRREEEERKIREEEERIAKKKALKKEKEREKKERQKREGTYKTATQKKKEAEDRMKVEMMRALLAKQKEEKAAEAAERAAKEQEAAEEAKAEEVKATKEEDDVLDDWENEEVKEEDVLDDWENEDLDDFAEARQAEAEQAAKKAEEEAAKKAAEEAAKKEPKLSKREQRELESRKREEEKRQAATAAAKEKEELSQLRSPIGVIMGHVDTGKTSLLDKIRHTTVQSGEAGGITQQIGATYFPVENLKKSTEKLAKTMELQYKVPGLLVIDTPGHESFSNLRSRGSNLCDIAILVVDIMHLLENTTIESLNMLRNRKCPFIVALNKVDRLYDWKPRPNAAIRDSLKLQPEHTREEFRTRVDNTIAAFMEQGLNAKLYWENDDPRNYISLVPTSAHSGEGIPDLLGLLMKLSQQFMSKRLTITEEVKATVLEKKVVEGLGTTLDVILVNGRLRVGDTIVLCGMNGPVTTTIRALLTPQPMRELRVKTMYIKHDEVLAAQGIKVAAHGLDDAVAGTSLMVCRNEEDLEEMQEMVQDELEAVRKLLKVDGEGVYVQASTLGSLEALLEFLGSLDPPIPVGAFNIGPIFKRDVIQAAIQLERKREYATILAFDVKIMPEAAQMAKEMGVRIFSADIIYHLFDQFTAYIRAIEEEKREASRDQAVFPCVLKIIPQYIFNRSNPIVVGVDVVEGILRPNTPLVVVIRKKKEVVKEKKLTLDDWMPDEDEDEDVSFKDSKKGKQLGESVETIEVCLHDD